MKTKLASAFGLAMLAVAFSFSSSFACPETPQTTASVVESTVSESGMNVAALASAPEGQVDKVAAPASVAGNIEAPSTDASAPPAVAFADAIPVEITETVTVVVPGQKSGDEEGPATPSFGIAIEPVTEASSELAAPESGAKATPDLSPQTGTAEAQIEVAEPAAAVAEVELPSTDVNAPPVVSVDAVPVEITETVTVVVPS
jgi:hypothetical protein